ncbi:hypothetical protein [Vagococcus carniphilus]|uniref:Uncharacterized protein n=1 Tax=Vagococcus carniphilus TaxID=218144 RepID=A0A430AUG1_9ENTE|nr:hypothetical protein [Vagococcus carniphilus]MDT2814697.1 hypothetical protein [Vagococcus carniphilus]MDT2832017.1 hypothetical protein [Vagococcus carniphilus]MDT2834579.1 hypothetical protein [Vagococcus carniphilus]MDT2840842.1 hypothetical protein [Vagococcus carniphilus]MDT2855506.1 hypothetical protein [Vagococcus carniphilus]
MKKFFSILVFLVIAAGGGYFVYNEYMKSKTPDVVATNTGKMDVNELDTAEYEKIDKETKKLAEKYKYIETFESFEILEGLEKEDTYQLDKYPDQKLYLITASKQKDGSVVAVFADKK